MTTNTILKQFFTTEQNKYIKSRKNSLNKKDGILTKIFSPAEIKEYENFALHKFRSTWGVRQEIKIADAVYDKYIRTISNINQLTRDFVFKKIFNEIKLINQQHFNVISFKKDKETGELTGEIKGAEATRAQRAYIYECIRDEIKFINKYNKLSFNLLREYEV